MSFETLNLNPTIFKAISICGYSNPTSIQSRSIPYILSGKDVVASAQTGTGKTAAFVLPALDKVIRNPSKGKPRVLILTPTRELATQITDAVSRYGKFSKPSIVSLLGGMPYHKQLKALSRQIDIIVATPGRLQDHMERGRVDLSGIEMLILDEADRMLDMGFIDDVTAIANKTPKTRQTLLFSATVDNKLTHIVRSLLNEPVRIDVTNEILTPAKIKQELYHADSPHHKMRLLMHLLENENMFKAIIFSATKINADRLAKELSDNNYPALPLHGDLKQNARNKTVEQLRRGKVQFVVATDVAARGIDISDITHVINFDLPRFSEDYVHRIGRTGRAGKTGTAISLALPSDYRHLQKIERYIGQKFSATTIPGLEPSKRQNSDKGSASKGGFKRGGDRDGESRFKRSGDKAKRFGGDRNNDNYSKRSNDKPKRFTEDRDSDNRFSKKLKRFDSDNDTSNRFKRDGDKPKRFGAESAERGSRFKRDGDKPKRFGAESAERGGRFKRDGDKPKRFGSESERGSRFKRDGDKPKRFGSESERGSRFKRDGDKPKRFGSESERGSRFKRDGDKPKRFGSESERGSRFKRDGDKPKRSFKKKN